MMLIGAVLVPVLAILGDFMHWPGILDLLVPISAVICFAGGLMRILYAVIYEESAPGTNREMPTHVLPGISPPAQLGAGARGSALPPAQTIPVRNFVPRRQSTAELVPPPSVTENTTRLLDEDKQMRGE